MSSTFELETAILVLFIEKQKEAKNLQTEITEEYNEKQKNDLTKFQQLLNEYKIKVESNTLEMRDTIIKESKLEKDVWWNLNCSK